MPGEFLGNLVIPLLTILNKGFHRDQPVVCQKSMRGDLRVKTMDPVPDNQRKPGRERTADQRLISAAATKIHGFEEVVHGVVIRTKSLRNSSKNPRIRFES